MSGLKVVSSYTPNAKLKVTVNRGGMQGSTYNPQKTSSGKKLQGSSPKLQNTYNPHRYTYNPQAAATSRQLERIRAADFQRAMKQQRIREQRERARRAAIRRRRLKDAKLAEIRSDSNSFAGKLAVVGGMFRQRGARELAVKYYNENELEWGTWIMAKQTNYEERSKELKSWVMRAKSEDDYTRRVREANAWIEKEYNDIDREIRDFRATQLELANYSQQPLTGKLAGGLRFSKNMLGGLTSKPWNALTFVASQPSRAINTAKNIIKPNNLRIYHGGAEKQGNIRGGGWQATLKRAYNETKDQRIIATSKAEESRRLAGWTKTINGRQISYSPKAASRFRIKYGDDIADVLADPMSWFSAGQAGRAGRFAKSLVNKRITKAGDFVYSKAGKSKALTNFLLSQQARKSNPNRISKWLGRKEGTRREDFFSDNRALIDKRQEVSDKLGKLYTDWKGRKYRSFAGTNRGQQLANLNDKQAELLQRYMNYVTYPSDKSRSVMKQQFSWDNIELPRGFGKQERRFIEDLARSLKQQTDWVHGKDIEFIKKKTAAPMYVGNKSQQRLAKNMEREVYGAYRKAYIPNIHRGEGYGKGSEYSRKVATWFNKQQKQIRLQRADELFQSYQGRTNATLNNVSKEKRMLDNLREPLTEERNRLDMFLNARSQDYKGSKLSKINEFSLRNRGKTPIGLWKKAVLLGNPAWWVNNLATNTVFGTQAGGLRYLQEFVKLMRSGKVDQARKIMPEGVAGNISTDIGTNPLARFASNFEDRSRIALFNAKKRVGDDDDTAKRVVNRWLFDYSNKNIERPLRGIFPFWQWQKNLVRLGATMPFHTPRAAKFYSEAYKGLYERPYNNLPTEEQTYIDPETGEERTFNPRQAYKGKAYLGTDKDGNPRFASLPFFATNPETMFNIGINPFLTTGMDLATSSDKFGRPNADRGAWQILAERFPQYNLGNNYLKRNDKISKLWFGESGNSKESQGYDQSKSNYVESLDRRKPFVKSLKSFFGIPNVVKFDRKEYDIKNRLTKFNKDFFAIDWDKKEDDDYKQAQLEKERLARKYGFDLQKDIYDNYWSKYDTETTKTTKAYKEDAAKFNSGFWRDYFKIPKGSKYSPSQRRPYVIRKFDEWVKNNSFAKNPYYKIPEWNEFKNGKATKNKVAINPFTLRGQEAASQSRRAIGRAKYERYLQYQKAKRTGDWSWFNKNGRSGRSSPYQFDGKFFKSESSMERYKNYRKNLNSKGEWKWQADGRYFKNSRTLKKYKEGVFWKKYYSLDSLSAKKKLLADNPQYRMFTEPKTSEEWNKVRKRIRTNRQNRADKNIKGFVASRKKFEAAIKENAPRVWGKSPKLRYK